MADDLFEDIVSFDLALFMKHLVSKEKQFTYVKLNRCFVQFKYLYNDANNKHFIKEVVGGHAAQNWCLPRLLPILLGDKIKIP